MKTFNPPRNTGGEPLRNLSRSGLPLAALFLLCSVVVSTAQGLCGPSPISQHVYGGPNQEVLGQIQLTTGDAVIVAGWSASDVAPQKTTTNYGAADGWVMKLDSGGARVWEQVYGGTNPDTFSVVVPTADGGFLLGGTSSSLPSGNKTSANYGETDFWIVRIDANGAKLWEQSYGGDIWDNLHTIVPMPDGGFILGGTSWSDTNANKTATNFGQADFWVVRINGLGTKIWDKAYGGNGEDELRCAALGPDGRVYLGGTTDTSGNGTHTNAAHGGFDSWLVIIDDNGEVITETAFGDQGYEALGALLFTPDGGLILGNSSSSYPLFQKQSPHYGSMDFWLVWVDSNLNITGQETHGGTDLDMLLTMIYHPDGGLLVGGVSYSNYGGNKASSGLGDADGWIVRIDDDRNKLWDKNYGGSSHDVEGSLSFQVTPAGQIVVGTDSSSPFSGNKSVGLYGEHDWWLFRLAAETDCDNDGVPNASDQCPDTPPTSEVTPYGCSIEQACPCTGRFETHDSYVACVTNTAAALLQTGAITEERRQQLVIAAQNSDCPIINGARVFFGLTNAPLGGAFFDDSSGAGNGRIEVRLHNQDGRDGATAFLGRSDSGVFVYPDGPFWGDFNEQWFMREEVYGRLNGLDGQLIAQARATKPYYEQYTLTVDFTALGAAGITIQYYSNSLFLAETAMFGPTTTLDIRTGDYVAPRFNPFWRRPDGSMGALLEATTIDYYANFGGDVVPFANRIFFRADNATGRVDFVARADVYAGGGVYGFYLLDERPGVFARPHKALGPVTLHPEPGRLAVRSMNPQEEHSGDPNHGVLIEGGSATYLAAQIIPFVVGPTGSFSLFSTDRPNISSNTFAGWKLTRQQDLTLHLTGQIQFLMNGDAPTNLSALTLKIYRDGRLAGTISGTNDSLLAILSDQSSNGVPAIIAGGAQIVNQTIALAATLDRLTIFAPPDGTNVAGNQFQLLLAEPGPPAHEVFSMSFTMAGSSELVITDETTDPSPPMVSVRRVGGDILLSWPVSNQPLIVESATTLPGAFTPVEGNVFLVNGQYEMSLPVEPGFNQFYRLALSPD